MAVSILDGHGAASSMEDNMNTNLSITAFAKADHLDSSCE
jgi:hypothetical protein